MIEPPRVTYGVVTVPVEVVRRLSWYALQGLRAAADRDAMSPPPWFVDYLTQLRELPIGTTSRPSPTSDVGGDVGRDSEATASSSGVTSMQLAEALGLGVRHAQDVARAAGVRSQLVGRSLLWDAGDVDGLAARRRTEGVA